jgi:hypothetical protein
MARLVLTGLTARQDLDHLCRAALVDLVRLEKEGTESRFAVVLLSTELSLSSAAVDLPLSASKTTSCPPT